MIKKAFIAFLLLLPVTYVNAQVFLGKSKGDVIASMKRENPAFTRDETVRNEKYNYLKYISDDDSETWIIVFDKNEKCSSVKITCDISRITEKRRELDGLYTKKGDDRWSLDQKTGNISIDLKNETWYFTITYRPAQKL